MSTLKVIYGRKGNKIKCAILNGGTPVISFAGFSLNDVVEDINAKIVQLKEQVSTRVIELHENGLRFSETDSKTIACEKIPETEFDVLKKKILRTIGEVSVAA
jgi:hypothetical protein